MRWLVASIAILGCCLGLAAAAEGEAAYVYDIPVGLPIEQLPGSAILSPRPGRFVWNIRVTQTAVTFRMQDALGQVIVFTAPAYVNDDTKVPLMFGPTIKLRAGDTMTIRLTNDLLQLEPNTGPEEFGYHDPMDTNLHTHGLHDETGVDNQQTAETYKGGDNVFVDLKARRTPDEAPGVLNLKSAVPREHMPGLHWYHPHKHGATAIQTSTTHGVIIVDDDQFWLPWNSGTCNTIWALLKTAPDQLFDISLLWFEKSTLGSPLYAADPTYQWVSGDVNASYTVTYPKNPLCCDKERTGYDFRGRATEGAGLNLITVNGGFQPVVTLIANTWTRWRFLYSGAKNWFVAQILERDLATEALANTDRCEIWMIAKDGVYLMKIPRQIPGMILAAANRVEAFVKCLPPPAGKTYVLSATNKAGLDPFNPGNNPDFQAPAYRLAQDVLAHIRVVTDPVKAGKYERAAAKTARAAAQNGMADGLVGAAASSVDRYKNKLDEETCTPKRASYARDLRDEALVKAGYDLAKIDRQVVNIDSNPTLPLGQQPGVGCRVNNETFIFPDPNPIVNKLGTIAEWSYNDVRWHPFHVHVNPYQLVKINYTQWLPGTVLANFIKEGDWYDNMLMPQIGGVTPSQTLPDVVRLRFQPGNFSGYAVIHCHYLMHEDVGCMKVVKWQCNAPGYEGEQQPLDGKCPGFTWPVPGDL